jgi:serine kinase of HPr protein (carbohydrate metabolism regulator)
MARVNIHGSCVRLGKAGQAFGAPADAGILILGNSGSGKSDLTLRMIERGATLVADDRTDLFVRQNRLYAAAPKSIAGYIEVRGLGIVELRHAKATRIALVVQLGTTVARMPVHKSYTPPAAVKLAKRDHPPLIQIDPFEVSAPAKVAIAAAAFSARLFREKVKPD